VLGNSSLSPVKDYISIGAGSGPFAMYVGGRNNDNNGNGIFAVYLNKGTTSTDSYTGSRLIKDPS
jgi:hypothetical protein